MSHRKDGIRDLQGILDRCHVDDVTGCWVWSGATINGMPRCHLPKGVLGNEKAAVVSVRRTAWMFACGPVKPHETIYRKADCMDSSCVNPDHARKGKQGAVSRERIKRHGVTPQTLVQLTQARAGQALTSERVAAIKEALAAGKTGVAISAELGVDVTTISKIKCGKHVSQRLAVVPGASVFSWGQR